MSTDMRETMMRENAELAVIGAEATALAKVLSEEGAALSKMGGGSGLAKSISTMAEIEAIARKIAATCERIKCNPPPLWMDRPAAGTA